jgi:hypothetical protein
MNNMENDDNMKRFRVQGKTKTLNSSILAPENAGLRFVLSITNTAGEVKSPLYPLFEKKWKKVREEARGWFATKTGEYKVGAIKTTAVQSDTWVIHLLCQDDNLLVIESGLVDCLKKVASLAKYEKASVHVSTILSDFIPELEVLLKEHLLNNGVNVYYYKEPV